MAYSIDFIKRAVNYKHEGHTFAQLREAFAIPAATQYDWEAKLNNGHFALTIKGERHRKIDKAALKQAVTERPDALLKEYAEQFGCTPTAIYYALEKLTITRKKPFTYGEKSEQERAKFATRLKRVPPSKRVYVDESDIHTCLLREYARAPWGKSSRKQCRESSLTE